MDVIGPMLFCLLLGTAGCGNPVDSSNEALRPVPIRTEGQTVSDARKYARLLTAFGRLGVLPAGSAVSPNGGTMICGYALPKGPSKSGWELGSFSAIFGPDGDLQTIFMSESESDVREIVDLCEQNGVRFR